MIEFTMTVLAQQDEDGNGPVALAPRARGCDEEAE